MARNVYSSKKEREDQVRTFIAQHGWPAWVNLINTAHDECPSLAPNAKWVAIGAGRYMAADWHIRQYVGYRCSGCGQMLQFTWAEPNPDEQPGEIEMLKIIP